MRIKIKNFAKIREADIEINGITVIAGENNTGKSTVGKVIYSLFDSFYNISKKVSMERKNRVLSYLSEIGYYDDNAGDYVYFSYGKNTEEIYNKLLEINIGEIRKGIVIDIYLSIFSDYISGEIFQIAGFKDVAEKIYDVMSISDEDIRKTIVNRVFNTEFNGQILPLFDADGTSCVSLQIKNSLIELKIAESVEIKKYIPLIYQVVYIDNPFILDSIEDAGLFRNRRYKGHSLSAVERLQRPSSMNIIDEAISNTVLDRIKNKINEVIQGTFVVEDNKTMFLETGLNRAISISNLSTGMKSFATLLRWLDNGYIIKNSFIILDEPEVNLHPKWQLKFAELLVIMQKELGLHILLNSHSPYFIEAIQVYSVKHEVSELYKYYLSDLESGSATFKDVTLDTSLIFDKLAEPIDVLEELLYGNKE